MCPTPHIVPLSGRTDPGLISGHHCIMTLYIFQPRELKNQETIAREQRLDKEMRTSIHAYLCARKDEQDREIAKTRLRESTLSDATQSDSVESTCSETITCSTGSDTSEVSMESVIPGRPHLNTTVRAHQDVKGIGA